MSVYVIAGVTGHVGSVAAGELLARGEKVRAIVRDGARAARWAERGAELAIGSLDDREFLQRALTGAAAFFAILPPFLPGDDFYQAQRRVADIVAGAVKASGAPRVVMLSSLGADLAEGVGPIKGLHYLENALRETGAKLIAVRPCYFQENIAALIPPARQIGIFPNFLPSADFRIPMVATRDIGRLAASLLAAPPREEETVDLVGPEYSARDLSGKLGDALGKPLQIVDVPPGGRVAAFLQAGLPRSLAESYAELYAALGAGLVAPRGDRLIAGATPIDDVLPGLLARPEPGTGAPPA